MLTDTFTQTLRTQFDSLPRELQFVLGSVDTRASLQRIVQKHGLRIDQAGALENETVLVLLGLQHPSEYIDSLAHHGELSMEIATAIAEDVNATIFEPVHQKLIELYALENQGPTTETPTQSATPQTPPVHTLVRAKLESTIRPSVPDTLQTLTKPATYQNHDPYREPIE